MQFVIIARDHKAESALARRMDSRIEHMEGIRRMKADGRVLDGGALLDDNRNMAGSVILCEFTDREALDAYLREEPYKRDNVWDQIEILEFRRVDWEKLMGPRA